MNYLAKLAIKNTFFSGKNSKIYFSDKVDEDLILLQDKLEDRRNAKKDKNEKSLIEELYINRNKDEEE